MDLESQFDNEQLVEFLQQTNIQEFLPHLTTFTKMKRYKTYFGCKIEAKEYIADMVYIFITLDSYFKQLFPFSVMVNIWAEVGLPQLYTEIVLEDAREGFMWMVLHMFSKWILTLNVDESIVFIDKIVSLGFDINSKANSGCTPLIYASQFGNKIAVKALLLLGADINEENISGYPALYIVREMRLGRNDHRAVYHLLRNQIIYMNIFKMKVHRYNQSRPGRRPFLSNIEKIRNNAETLSKIKVETLCLKDFLSRQTFRFRINSLDDFPVRRLLLEKYVKAANNKPEFRPFLPLINLQYRDAVRRSRLEFITKNSINNLIRFNLPDICVENILQYLNSKELKRLVEASTL